MSAQPEHAPVTSLGTQRARRLLSDLTRGRSVTIVFLDDEVKVYCIGLSEADKMRVESLVEEIGSA